MANFSLTRSRFTVTTKASALCFSGQLPDLVSDSAGASAYPCVRNASPWYLSGVRSLLFPVGWPASLFAPWESFPSSPGITAIPSNESTVAGANRARRTTRSLVLSLSSALSLSLSLPLSFSLSHILPSRIPVSRSLSHFSYPSPDSHRWETGNNGV